MAMSLLNFSKDKELNKVMDNFAPSSSLNIHNLVTTFKQHIANKGYIDNIFLFRSKNHCDYIEQFFS